MKIWKLVSGILSIVFCGFVLFQSCATGVVNALDNNSSDLSGTAGVMLAILMVAGGIISVATRNGGKGGSIAVLVLFLLAAVIGFANQGTYTDLVVWSVWCVIVAIMAVIAVIVQKKQKE